MKNKADLDKALIKNNFPFIITITGPSQSGKTLVKDKIERLGLEWQKENVGFFPIKIKKYTTRNWRLGELEAKEHNRYTDVECVNHIPDDCDLVYQASGIRYGIKTDLLKRELASGRSLVIIVNDIRAVEELRRVFPGQVLALFLFRKIPQLEDFKKEAENRGNVSEQEIQARYEKAIAIYRTYIENIILFDKVVLNAIEYKNGDEREKDTIIDIQLANILLPIIKKEKCLRNKLEYEKVSRVFVIAGNAASGKDEIVRALQSMGKLQAQILPKYTMRQQEPEDGTEMICRYKPKKRIIHEFQMEYEKDKLQIEKNLDIIQEDFISKYKKEFIDFKQKVEKEVKNEYERFWYKVDNEFQQCKGDVTKEEILKKYFEDNEQYQDLAKIKNEGEVLEKEGEVGLFRYKNKTYIIYGEKDNLYGCDITHLLKKNDQIWNKTYIIVASQLGVVNILKKRLGVERVKFIYAHSDVSEQEYEKNAVDTTKADKIKKFRKILNNYAEEISNYDHVTIYAKSKLTYEQTSKEEELIDQMFRLLRAYK